jgi:hypothetical protein
VFEASRTRSAKLRSLTATFAGLGLSESNCISFLAHSSVAMRAQVL